MKAYLMTLVGAILISAVVSALVSEKKMGKFIKGVAQLFVFSVLVLPLIDLFDGGSFRFTAGEVETDGAYLARCAELLEREREGEIERYLAESFSLSAEAEVVRGGENGLAVGKITVKIAGDGISGQDEHIDMVARIEAALRARYGCEAEVIWE